MGTEAVQVSQFTGPIGFEVYTGTVSNDQRLRAVHELRSLEGVDIVVTRTDAPKPHSGYTLRVILKQDADPRDVQRQADEKMKDLVLSWGTFPPPALTRY